MRGRTLIQGGRLFDHETAPIDGGLLALHIECGAQGELALGMACVRDGAEWVRVTKAVPEPAKAVQ